MTALTLLCIGAGLFMFGVVASALLSRTNIPLGKSYWSWLILIPMLLGAGILLAGVVTVIVVSVSTVLGAQ